jgi:hypothetical protein
MPPATAQPAAISKKLFSAGEIDPSLRTRPDTETWQAGLATFRNMVGKKSGGGRNRPGSIYVGPAMNNQSGNRLLEFDYADGFNDSFAVLCEAGITSFAKSQVLVTEIPLQITAITNADPGVFTIESNGFVATDVLFINNTGLPIDGNYFRLSLIDDNTFNLTDLTVDLIDTTNLGSYSGSGGTAAKVYVISNPFSSASLPFLNYDQDFDQLKIASGSVPLQDLNYLEDTNWQMQNSLFEPSISAPTGLTVSNAGTSSTYGVTALKNGTGEESLLATTQGATGSTGSPQTFSWSSVSDAFFYNVYRADADGVFGLIGVVPAQTNPEFVDDNIPAPNFNIQPPGQEGTLFDFGLTLQRLDSSIFPVTALPGNGLAVAWSPQGDLLAVGCATTPYLLIYSFNGGGFTLISAISVGNLPAGQVNALEWSPDGTYLAAAVTPATGTTYAILYKRSGQTLTPTTGITTQPYGPTLDVSWSDNSQVVCFVGHTSPYVWVYERSGDTFTKLTDIGTTSPTGHSNSTIPLHPANCCCIIPFTYLNDDGDPNPQNATCAIFVGHGYDSGSGYSGAFYVLYNQTWATQEGNASNWFGGGSSGTPFHGFGADIISCDLTSTEGTGPMVVFGMNGGNYVSNFIVTATGEGEAVLTLQAVPFTLPSGNVNGITANGDGTYVALGTSGTQKLMLYQMIAGVLVYNGTQPTPDNYDVTLGVAFSPDASLLAAVNQTTTPYASMYGVSVVHPACVGFAQQRLRIGNTSENPGTEYDSAEDAYTNFAERVVPPGATAPDTDPIQFLTWSRKFNALKHLISLKKLIQLTSNGVIVLEGDGNGNISPTEVNPRLVGYNGANYVRPAFIGDTAVYVGASNNTLWDLKKEVTASSYFASDNFFTTDLTVPSAHIFRGKTITWLCYQEKPDSIIWGGLSDGTYFSLTYVRDQGVFTFGRHDWGGLGTVVDGCCVRESDGTDRVYLTVDLSQDPYQTNYIRVAMQDRDETSLEDQWFVDAGVKYDGRNTSAIGLSVSGNPIVVTATSPLFDASSVGRQIRIYAPSSENPATTFYEYGFSDYQITAYTSPTQVTVDHLRDVGVGSGRFSGEDVTRWSWLTNTVSGLWHLNGFNLSVLADGEVISSPNNPFLQDTSGDAVQPLQPTNGQLTFDIGWWAEVVIAGLPFTSDIETLEMDTPTGPALVELKKNVPRINAKVYNTKGLFFGKSAPAPPQGGLYNDKATGLFLGFHGNRQPTSDQVGAVPIPLLTDRIYSPIDGDWNSYGHAFIRQVDPLPLEINGLYPVMAM